MRETAPLDVALHGIGLEDAPGFGDDAHPLARLLLLYETCGTVPPA